VSSRRDNSAADGFEALEPRLVFASYSLGDYLAAADGDRWNFRGTSGGSAATATLEVRGNVQSSAGAIFDMRVGSGFLGLDIERHIQRTGAGLFELSEDATLLGEGARTAFASPLRLLPLTFADGQRFDFTMGVSVTVLPEGTPTITGTLTGVLQILGGESVTTPAGSFQCVHARLTTHARAMFQGSTGTVDATEDWWLTRSVGFVRIDAAQTSSGDGETQTTSYSVGLTSSNRLAPPGEIAVTGNGVNIAHNDSTPRTADHTGFGSINVETGTKLRTFTIRNAHSSNTLELGSVTLSGANQSEFAIVRQPSQRTLQPGQSVTFKVRFDPSGTGVRKATVAIASNDQDENPFRFRVRGQGVQSAVTAAAAESARVVISLNLLTPAAPPVWSSPLTRGTRSGGLVVTNVHPEARGSANQLRITFSGLSLSSRLATDRSHSIMDLEGSPAFRIRFGTGGVRTRFP
jgi:hypothetical protein